MERQSCLFCDPSRGNTSTWWWLYKGHFAVAIHETAYAISFVFAFDCICFPAFKYLLSSPGGIAFVLFDLEKRPLGITVLVYEQESDKARA